MTALLAAAAALAAQATTPGSPSGAAATPVGEPEIKIGSYSYIDLEAGAGYSSNPLLSTTSSTGQGFGRVSVHAVHTRVSERTTTTLSAFGQNTTYTKSSGSLQSLSVSGRHDAAVNEKLRLFGDASASYDRGGQLDTRIVTVPGVPSLPGIVNNPPQLLPPGSDFLSVTGRTYGLSADVGGTLATSARDNLDFSAGVQHVVFKGGGANNSFTSIPLSLGYGRQLSPRATFGARLRYQDTNYRGPASFRVLTPELTANVLLGERLNLNGAVGVSFAHVNDGARARNSTGLSGRASLCGNGERDQYCARVAVDQEAATTAGPAKTISGGLDYSRRLDAKSSVQLSAGISRYTTPISVISGQVFNSSTYCRVAASYSRRLSDRLFGGADLAARKLSQSGPNPKTDLNASLFIRYRFGDKQ